MDEQERYEANLARAKQKDVAFIEDLVNQVAVARQNMEALRDPTQAAYNRMAKTTEWQEHEKSLGVLKLSRNILGTIEEDARNAGIRLVQKYGADALPAGLFAETHHPINYVVDDIQKLTKWLVRVGALDVLKVDAGALKKYAKDFLAAWASVSNHWIARSAFAERFGLNPEDVTLPVEDWDAGILYPFEYVDEIVVKIRSELNHEKAGDDAPDDR